MAINKIEVALTTDQIIEDLNNGLTWLKKDDMGYGSIEVKYGATPFHIATIRKHPLLKDVDTTVKVFIIIDSTKNDSTTTTKESSSNRTSDIPQQSVVEVVNKNESVGASTSEAADIFANL